MDILILFAVSILFNVIFLLNFKNISKLLNIYDKPDGKLKKHQTPTPLLGGVILINLYFVSFFIYLLDLEYLIFKNNFIVIIISLSTIFYIIGLVDDLKNLNPNLKLFLIVISVIFLIYLFPDLNLKLIKISFLDKIYYFNNYSFFFIVLSFALLLNALNMFDGINLQLILFSSFIFCFFILKGFYPIFFILLLFPMIVLAILNYKNKVFLGDGGSYIISAIIGSTFIYQYKNFDNFFYGDEIFLILFVPAIDMLRLFIIRLAQKKNPFKGDLNHLHHIVNNFTKDKNKTIFITLILCILPSIFLIFNLNTLLILLLNLMAYFSLILYLRYKNR